MVINPENPYLDNNTVLSTHLTQSIFVKTYFVNPEDVISGVIRVQHYENAGIIPLFTEIRIY